MTSLAKCNHPLNDIPNYLNAKGFGEKLMRVDNGQFENAQLDVEYYSSNQHGTIFGSPIYRIYKNIPDTVGAGSTVSVGLPRTITRLLNMGGYTGEQGGTRFYPVPHAGQSTNTNIEASVNTARNGVDIKCGSGFDHDGGYMWIDYCG